MRSEHFYLWRIESVAPFFRFNRPEHYGYDGEVPDEGWFLDRFSTPAEVESVRKFRSLKMSEPGATYNFNRELDTYLRQDVRPNRRKNFFAQDSLPRLKIRLEFCEGDVSTS